MPRWLASDIPDVPTNRAQSAGGTQVGDEVGAAARGCRRAGASWSAMACREG
jgi:hypothetical protein